MVWLMAEAAAGLLCPVWPLWASFGFGCVLGHFSCSLALWGLLDGFVALCGVCGKKKPSRGGLGVWGVGCGLS